MHGPEDGWKGSAPLHEYNVAAACGGFWGGPRDAAGIPAATMWDGTPPGYAILGFEGDRVSLDYVPSQGSAAHQLEIHAAQVGRPEAGLCLLLRKRVQRA